MAIKTIPVTNGPGRWNLVIEGVAQGEWQQFTVVLNEKTYSFAADVVGIRVISRTSQSWTLTCRTTPGTKFFDDSIPFLTKVFKSGEPFTFNYSTLDRTGEIKCK